MIVIENGDLIEGDATTASEVDFVISGLDNNALVQFADGQLANSKGTLYTANSTDVVSSIILVNTGAAHNHVNLYSKSSGGTSRRLIAKDLQLESGYSLHFDGSKMMIMSASGGIVSSANISDAAYAASWDGVTMVAPSKNAVYDAMTQANIVGLKTTDSPVFVTAKLSGLTDLKVPKHVDDSTGLADTTITVSANNEVTNASQPAFLARPTAQQDNTAINSYVTVVFGTEVYDIGGNFASNIFTAPVTGKYLLNVFISLLNIDSASPQYQIALTTSNRGYTIDIDPSKFSGDVAYLPFTMSVLTDMDAADTAFVRIYQVSGTQQTDIGIESFFSGCLLF